MTGRSTRSTFFKKRLAFFAGIAVILLLFASQAQAQLTRTERIELEDGRKITYVGPDSYVTSDPGKELSSQVVINRHKNNLRGERQSRHVIDLGSKGEAAWILFSVTNSSSQQDWVLDFGKIIDGRSALAETVDIYLADSNMVLSNLSGDTQNISRKIFNNRAVNLTIPEGQTELIALHINPENTLTNSLAPYFISKRDYTNSFNFSSDPFNSIIYAFFAGMIGIFIAITYLRRSPYYTVFSAYYIVNTLLFYIIESHFFVSSQYLGEGLLLLYVLSTLLGLFMTRAFFRITFDHHAENTAIFALAALTLVSGLIGIFVVGNTTYGHMAIQVPAGLSMFAIAILAFFKGQAGQYAGVHYAAAWLVTLIGLVISTLSAQNIFPVESIYLNAQWFALFPQGMLFVLSVKKRIEMVEEEERHRRSRETREVQSRARLKHSKESADQARLLRVIERERELMAELREREMQRTEEMRIAKEMAVDADRAKSAFLAVVSHEIRTPMTGILGILRLLGDTSLNKEQQEYLMSIQTSGDTMMALLNDILDFEKIERGSMDLEEIDFDLSKLVEGVVTLMSGHAADKGLVLKSNISDSFPAFLIGDPTRLRQILLNLVNNAIKFTQQGDVTIHLKATPIEDPSIKSDYEIYIAVEDTGIGISEEAQRKLFSPFEQADNTVARRFGGTGLGLAICKRLVEAMGGAISVKSEEGNGSTFFFSILMNTGQSDSTIESVQTGAFYTADIPTMSVLVIEDNEMNRKVLLGFLEKGGHKVHLAESGEEGLNILKDHSFDAIFTDINLTGMDGIETAKTIRALPDREKAQTPLIAITGNVSQDDIKKYEEGGLNGFLPKPIVPEKLYEILEQIHRGGEAHEDVSPPAHETTPKEPPPAAEQSFEYEEEAEDDFDSFQDAELLDDGDANPEGSFGALDLSMIQGLLDSLGSEQFKSLMDGYIEKADEIVEALVALKDSGAGELIRDKAHEIKGMAANFGVSETAAISGVIESAAQNNDLETAYAEIERLPEANQRAKDAIAQMLIEKT